MRDRDISAGTAGVLLAATVIVATVLRLIGSDSQLWYDEVRTLVGSVREPLAVILTHFPSNNDHVLYSILAHLSIGALGESSFALRLPAIVCGIVSIPLIYRLGTEVTTRFEAIASALFAAVAAQHIWFSDNARGYTLLLVVALVSTRAILAGLRTRGATPWIAFAIVAALGAYTHLTMVIAVVAQAIVVAIHLIAGRRASPRDLAAPLAGFAGAGLLSIVLYAPMLGDVASFFGDPSSTHKAASAGWALAELARNLDFGLTGGFFAAGVALIMIAGLISYTRQSPFFVALCFLPPALIYVVSALLDRPTFPRFFFFASGFLILVGLRGVMVILRSALRFVRLSGRREAAIEWACVATIVLVLAADLSRSFLRPKMDYEGARAFVTQGQAGNVPVALGEIGVEYVYTKYYGERWPALRSAGDLMQRLRGGDLIVLYTFERYLADGDPALLASLRAHCSALRTFGGTLADGDIHVLKCAKQP